MDSARDLRLVELSEEVFPLTTGELAAGVAEGVAPGMVVGFWHRARPDFFFARATGERRLPIAGLSSLPMTIETGFDLASVSKVFATATLAALLVDRRWLRWDTPLRSILPEFKSREVTLVQLLSHTAGLPAWEPLWERMRARFAPGLLHEAPVTERQRAMRELVFAVEPNAAPGERAVYSDICFLLLGFALEEVLRLPLHDAVRRHLWEPLGVEASFRLVKASASQRDEHFAATEDCPWRGGVLQGQVHDDNCWSMGGYAGHAGAFGTARDLLQFARQLLIGGFLSRETLQAAWTRMPVPPGCERTPGWDTPSGENPAAGHFFGPGSVGHVGYTGTSLWLDPGEGLAVTLLTNRVHPSRENIRIRAFRTRLHDALRTDLAANGGRPPG